MQDPHSSEDEEEVALEVAESPKPPPPAKPRSKAKPTSKTTARPMPKPAYKGKGAEDSAKSSDARSGPASANQKGKGKGRAADDDDGSEVEVVESSKADDSKRTGKKAGKRKASEDSGAEDVPTRKGRGRGTNKAGSEVLDVDAARPRKARAAPSRGGGRARSAQPKLTHADDDSDASARDGEEAPRKKRKINLFSAAAEPTSFAALGLGTGNIGGLDIPTMLSPVKESEVVASRSMSGGSGSGSILGRVGSVLANSFRR